jgi:hypothetical protein
MRLGIILLFMAFLFILVIIWGLKKFDNKLAKEFDQKYRESRRNK